MPPTPQSPSALAASLSRRLSDIRTFQLPRMRACPGPLALHQQYAQEMREDVEGVQRGLRVLEVRLEDEEDGAEREKLSGEWERLGEELNQLKKESRAAVLSSKKAIDARGNRSELLTGAAPDSALEKTDDALTNTSNEVTLSLRRTMALMQQEVERSVLSTQMLDESSRTLHSTTNTYISLSSLLNTSKALITALERADWLDRALIFAALAFFLLVVGFILKQRIFDRGVRLAFWWIKYLPSFGDEGLGVEEAMEKAEEVTSVVISTTTALAAAAASLASGAVQQPSILVETITEIVTVSRTVDVHTPAGASGLSDLLSEPTHTHSRDELAKEVSPTDAPDPEAEEFPSREDFFPDEATPLDDVWTAAPPQAASPPVHIEL